MIVARYGGEQTKNLNTEIKSYLEKYKKDKEASASYDFCTENKKLKDLEFNFLEYFWEEQDKVPVSDFCKLFVIVLCLEKILNDEEVTINDLKTDNIKQTFIFRKLKKRDDIVNHWEDTVLNFIKTFEFLYLVCGVPSLKDLPYLFMFIPLYCSLREGKYTEKSVLKKCAYWYWTMLFSGRYYQKHTEHCIADIKRLYNFCHGNDDSKIFEEDEKNVFNTQRYSDEKTLALTDDTKRDDPKDFNSNLTEGLF